MKSDLHSVWACKPPSSCCVFVDSLPLLWVQLAFIFMIIITWYCSTILFNRIIVCLHYIQRAPHGCIFSFYHMLSIVCPSSHWSTQLPDGHGPSLIELTRRYFSFTVTHIANKVLSQHTVHRSVFIHKKKINNTSI